MEKRIKLLIVDDEDAICFAFKRFFEARDCEVRVAATLHQGLAECTTFLPDFAFIDVCLPDGNGLALLEQLPAAAPGCRAVVITAFGSLENVSRAVRGKALDCLVKPIDLDHAEQLIQQAVRQHSRHAVPDAADALPAAGEGDAMLIGQSPAMQQLYKQIGRAAGSDAPVLITGETGTGKECTARAIHAYSDRAGQTFMAVNCGAIPEQLVESELFGVVKGAYTGAVTARPGRFEAADGGTLFLDEVGELPLAAQVKLLRILDQQTVERLGSNRPIHLDVRIIAATNSDLSKAVAGNWFRSDLYYRLAVLQIAVPPLRERTADIPLLVRHFLPQFSTEPAGITPEALASLQARPWPGNVRELRNAVHHAAVAAGGEPITTQHLPPPAPLAAGSRSPASLLAEFLQQIAVPGQTHARAVRMLEAQLISDAMTKFDGNLSAAADYLGIHRNTLRAKLRDLPDLGQ
jgi:two-component system nitrogen regulation response regulator GlnG